MGCPVGPQHRAKPHHLECKAKSEQPPEQHAHLEVSTVANAVARPLLLADLQGIDPCSSWLWCVILGLDSVK